MAQKPRRLETLASTLTEGERTILPTMLPVVPPTRLHSHALTGSGSARCPQCISRVCLSRLIPTLDSRLSQWRKDYITHSTAVRPPTRPCSLDPQRAQPVAAEGAFRVGFVWVVGIVSGRPASCTLCAHGPAPGLARRAAGECGRGLPARASIPRPFARAPVCARPGPPLTLHLRKKPGKAFPAGESLGSQNPGVGGVVVTHPH